MNYTNKELDKITDEIFYSRDYYSEQYGFNIVGVASVFSEGKIKIQIPTENNISKVGEILQQYYDVPIEIEMVSNNDFKDESAIVRPGSGITGCTAGFPATKGGKYYMITAGHCSASKFYLTSGGFVGNRNTVYDKNGGSVDAVAINVNRSQLSSKLVYSTASLSTYQRAGGELLGQTVWLQGSRSGGMSFGTLQTIHYHFTYNGIAYYNMRAANYSSTSGDSGGIIHNSSQLMGIHKGTFGGYKVYTHVTNIMSEFGITPYFP